MTSTMFSLFWSVDANKENKITPAALNLTNLNNNMRLEPREPLIHKPRKIPVYVNVYDMLPRGKVTDFGYRIGMGVFHSGVEILGREYNFGGHDYDYTGVFIMKPKTGPPNVTFKETITMGFAELDKDQIKDIIQELSEEYRGNTYNLLTRNCNHFSNELCRRLIGKSTPSWINRAAKLGTFFPCVVPNGWIEPPECEENGNSPITPTSGATTTYEPYLIPDTRSLKLTR
ncbi:hypothetical protein G9A89_020747 [Geosiphon pyriformis]|nr:hypothetical protein G9A89_020747 [Geosiphon pyriformis]